MHDILIQLLVGDALSMKPSLMDSNLAWPKVVDHTENPNSGCLSPVVWGSLLLASLSIRCSSTVADMVRQIRGALRLFNFIAILDFLGFWSIWHLGKFGDNIQNTPTGRGSDLRTCTIWGICKNDTQNTRVNSFYKCSDLDTHNRKTYSTSQSSA